MTIGQICKPPNATDQSSVRSAWRRNAMSTAESIAWGVWGVLSFIFLIVYLRWVGTPEEQKDEPPEEPKRQAENDLI